MGFVVVMFGFVCLCNISLSNQSPAPEYDYDGEYDASSDYDATYDYDQTVDYYDYDSDYDSDQTVDYYDYDSHYDLYDAPAGETCPITCEQPKSKRCKQRKAAAKCGNQGQNSGGGSKKTCPVKCKLPDSERCKRKNKNAGCNNNSDPPTNVRPIKPKVFALSQCMHSIFFLGGIKFKFCFFFSTKFDETWFTNWLRNKKYY